MEQLKTDANGYYFQDGNTFYKLGKINNVIIRADVITLDNTVDNNLTKHLLEGQSFETYCSTIPHYHTDFQHRRR